jgi:hypothetical protein
VVVLWRRYLVHMDELENARRALRNEAEGISRALKDARH